MHNLHVRTVATDANWAMAQRIDYCIWRIKSTCIGVLYRYFLQKLAKKGDILLEQTAQALIRLHRYLGMQSQLTMHTICSFFLDVALTAETQPDVTWATTQKMVLAKTNEVTPQAHARSMIRTIVSFYNQCAWGKFRQLLPLLTNRHLPLLTRGKVYS